MADAFSDFTDLYNEFRNDPYFATAVKTLTWIEDNGSTIDPSTGIRTDNKVTHITQCFETSSGDESKKPKSQTFDDVQVNDRFAKTLKEDFPTPPNGTQVTFDGSSYTVIEVIKDPIQLTDSIQLRN